MKKFVYLFPLSLVLSLSCQKEKFPADANDYVCSLPGGATDDQHPKAQQYQHLLDELVKEGVPGILMSVYDPVNGPWTGAAGKADLSLQIPMRPCQMTRVGSTVKTYTAVTVLMLAEEGLIDLDAPIAQYLDGEPIQKIKNADKATVHQLLHHTAGMFNYIQNLQFQTASLNDLLREWQPEDLLKYAYHKPAYFAPGEDVTYSNTHYILLGMLIEKVTGKPFYQVFQERIFTPLNLSMTRFAATDHVPTGIAKGYIDLYSNLNVMESTYYSGWDYYTADGGLISNPYDMCVFMRALCTGQLLNQNSMDAMMDWKTKKNPDPEFYTIRYGLGIFEIDTEKGKVWYHSGDAIGYYANMMYFPEDGTAIAYAVNGNYGKIDELTLTKKAIGRIIAAVK